jgi:antitoxin ParD1/3/4
MQERSDNLKKRRRKSMNVAIPTEMEGFVATVVQSGTYRDPAEVVGEALRLLEKREKLRQEIQAGIDQLDRGEYTEYDESTLDNLLEDIREEERRLFPPENLGP